MVNGDIFLGSGASITKVPELDLYCKITTASAGSDVSTFTLHTDFTNNFALVNNLYVGCVIRRYNSGDNLQTIHRITANTETTITITPSVATLASDDYFIIESYGAPCPAPKESSGTVHTDLVTTITFLSDDKTDYNDDVIVLNLLSAETSGGGTLAQAALFIDSSGGQTYSGAISTTAEVAIDGASNNTREEFAAILATAADGLSNASATRNGATVTITSKYGGSNAVATTMSQLDGTAKTINSNLTITSTVGTTTSASTGKRLLADTWLGITESITFPTTEVEMKQTNLSLGGSRNFTYQYKGIETAGAADLNLVANHGAWLYYFLGRCTNVDIGDISTSDVFSESAPSGTPPTDDFTAESANAVYIDYNSISETGPIFQRSVRENSVNVMTPPVNISIDDRANLDKVGSFSLTSGKLQNAIKYTFAEQEQDLLPSFALEQVLSKLPSSNTYRTQTADANEELNFVKIARGCRVNTLTLTANENEEVKMTINANTRNVHSLEKTESYDARRGVVDETSFFNFTSIDELREPFFFSDGVFKCFGHAFLKINTLTLTMNNSLQDRRFFGVGSKSIQEAIPAQRTYEISFTGHVTDDRLYNELLNQSEDTSNTIELTFTKSTGEKINLNFQNYYLSANNFPIADDKGPIVVEATVMPRTCSLCEVTTHWMLQG